MSRQHEINLLCLSCVIADTIMLWSGDTISRLYLLVQLPNIYNSKPINAYMFDSSTNVV